MKIKEVSNSFIDTQCKFLLLIFFYCFLQGKNFPFPLPSGVARKCSWSQTKEIREISAYHTGQTKSNVLLVTVNKEEKIFLLNDLQITFSLLCVIW